MSVLRLKPCPFCGDAPQLYRGGDGEPLGPPFNYECVNPDCEAMGPWGENEVTAAASWNLRDGEFDLVERIAAFVEGWGGAPPSPYGRRKQVAADIRARLFDQEDANAVGSAASG